MSGYVFGSPEFARSGCGCLVVLVLVIFGTIVMLEPNVTWVSARGGSSYRRPRRVCSGELLLTCQRIEDGQTPAETLALIPPDQMLVILRACTECGYYPRIAVTLIPDAEKLKSAMDEVRAQMSP